MKLLVYSLAGLITAVSLFGQLSPPHKWNATISVYDEAEHAVSGASVSAIFSTFTPQGKRVSTNISGLSNDEGVFHASSAYTGAPDMLFRVTKAGYYNTARPFDLGDYYSIGRWNPEVKLVLKKIGNPISMCVKRIDAHPPATGKPVGFDLHMGEWVSPYGAGKTADILFQWTRTTRSRFDYDSKLMITFLNSGDGIQEYTNQPDDGRSDLDSPREAPASGYEPEIDRVNISHPPDPVKWDYNPDRCYLFRVNTTLDNKGNVKSALYGKIYGDFMHFTYYLNPSPNDRTLEFNPGQNLIVGQKVANP
jgi:hypothetical protein